jgi:hypothetical protein
MPTVHLSLPDSVYRKLKERATELGIQVTDLIKIYIKNGLDGVHVNRRDSEDIGVLARKVENLERELRAKTILLEGRYREITEILNYVMERIEQLEDLLELSKSRSPEIRNRSTESSGLV